MASALMIVLAASGLVSAGVPAATAPAAKSAAMVVANPKAPVGVCMVPTTKGKVSKLSSIRKARDGRSCSFQYMAEGTTGGSTGIAGLPTGAVVGTAAGLAGGIGIGAAAWSGNNNAPNP